MDRYLNTRKQKNDFEFTKLGPAVCVLGRSGIGKTWAVHQALDPCIEIGSEILKSKQTTLEFLDKIKGTDTPVLIDEYETLHDLVGLKEITEPPTSGLFVVVSQIPVNFDFEIKIYEYPVPTFEKIKALFPHVDEEIIRESNGDVRFVLQSASFRSDAKDIFQGTKEFLNKIVSRTEKTNPCDYIGHPLTESGNIASILQANYPDSKGRLEVISEQLSVADIFDNKIYEGEWNLLPYFCFFGCVLPACEIAHTLGPNLKAGETWTKYQNQCMRSKRIATMTNKVPHQYLDMDSLLLIRSYIEKDCDEALNLMRKYEFTSQDVDVLNHLSPYRKIKPKTISYIKKWLKDPPAPTVQ